MSQQVFCTQCGAGLAPGAGFCTSCGAAADGSATSARPVPAATARPIQAKAPARVPAASATSSPAVVVVAALLLAAGGGAAWFSLGTKQVAAPRAVAGAPGAPSGGMGQGSPGDESLPNGHPNIELPEEVKTFLKGLADEAEKNPTNVEAWQKLTRARYRASVINPSWQEPAASALKKLLELEPENLEGLRISANLAYDAADFPEAQKRFEKFLEKSPDDASARTDLGSTLLFQDRIDLAIEQYGMAIAKDPKFMQAQFNMGIALEKAGKTPEAIVSLKKAFELAESPDQKQHIENAVAELEKREPKKIEGAAPSIPAPGRDDASASASGGQPAAAPPAAAAPPSGAPAGMGSAAVATPPRPPATMAPAAGGGMAMPPPAPERDVPTNASTDYHRAVQKGLIVHPIVGPRVTGFEWTGPASGRVKIANFPMDQMPPFARAKFESGMNEKLAAAAKANGVQGPLSLEIVDDPSGRVMDTLSGVTAPAGAAPAGMP